MLKSNPQRLLAGGAFGQRLNHEGGALVSGIHLIKEAPEGSPVPGTV